MSVLEKTIEAKFVRWLKQNKIKWRQKERGALLDRWIMLPNGYLFIVELKRPIGELSPRQITEIIELRKLYYDIEVHDNADEAIKAISDRLEAARLSKEGDKIHAAKLLRGSILRSRAREDKYYPRKLQNSKARGPHRLHVDRRAIASMLLRLAA